MRTKLQRLLNRLDGTNERTASAISEFESGVKTLRQKLQQEISASTLEEVNLKINKLRKSVDLEPILKGLQDLESNFRESILSILSDIESKSTELKNLTVRGDRELGEQSASIENEIAVLRETLDNLVSSNRTQLNLINTDLTSLLSKNLATQEDLSSSAKESKDLIDSVKTEKDEDIKKVNKKVDDARVELIERITNKGGGNMNRQVLFNSTNYLKKYTDYNLIAGNNVTFTISENNTAKRVNLTIASSGSGGGRVRLIQSVAVDTVMGDDADTDYVYLVSGTTSMTLPTATGNDNQYTIKNVGVGVVTVVGTIDNDTNVVMPVRYTSVDIISNDTDWNIT